MSTEKNKHTNRLVQSVLAVSLAASAGIPSTATAQATLSQAAPYSSIQVAVIRWGTDPNMPSLGGSLGEAVDWFVVTDDQIRVDFRRPSSRGTYLGFNEKGSWVRNENDRKVYIWNLKDRTLTLGAESDKQVPLDLKNPSSEMKGLIAVATGHVSAGHTVANISGRNTPYIPPSVIGDGNAQHASAETRTAVFSPSTGTNSAGIGTATQIKGSAATIKAGVLTFTNEQGASVSMKVMRPPNQAFGNPNAAKPTGSAGAWLAEDPNDKGAVISLNVAENGAVSGTKMTGIAAEAIKRIMNTPTAQKP